MDPVRTGQLVIADVSGYTRFVTGTELEHARDILSDLLDTIATGLQGTLSIEKVEGDAIFAVTPTKSASDQSLLDTIEQCYFGFRRRRETIHNRSSCTCNACSGVPSLDLKFVAHHGQFATHTVAGKSELVGTDVIVVHRLLKNTVPLRGYALFTTTCAESALLDADSVGATPHTEELDDVGTVQGYVVDLGARWEAARALRRVRAENPAVHEVGELPVPPQEAWRWITEPDLRVRYQPATDRVEQVNPEGGMGIGTRNHCVHGKQSVDEEIVDWKPYDYFTLDATTPMGPVRITFDLEPLDGGTRTRVTFSGQPLGGRKQKAMLALGAKKMFKKQVRATMDGLARQLSSA